MTYRLGEYTVQHDPENSWIAPSADVMGRVVIRTGRQHLVAGRAAG